MRKLLIILMCLLVTACGPKKEKETVKEEFNFSGIWEAVSVTYEGTTFTVKELETMDDFSCSGIYFVIKDGGTIVGFEKNENGGSISYVQDGDALTLESGYTLELQGNGEANLVMDEGYMTFKKYSSSQDITNVPEYVDSSIEVVEEPAIEEEKEEAVQAEEQRAGIRFEFKAAMDAYESFYDEYVTFMKKYKENSSDLGLIADYGKFMIKMADMDKKFEAWDDDELSNEELSYYIEVQGRVLQKIATIY